MKAVEGISVCILKGINPLLICLPTNGGGVGYFDRFQTEYRHHPNNLLDAHCSGPIVTYQTLS